MNMGESAAFAVFAKHAKQIIHTPPPDPHIFAFGEVRP